MNISTEIEQAISTIEDFPKPGISFKDITPILLDHNLCDRLTDALIEDYRDQNVEMIAAIESRGFILGAMMAQKLECGLTLVRKAGKLPGPVEAQSYDLEYGSATIEMNKGSFEYGTRVLIHDDLLATGGTAQATAQLCKRLGAEILGFNFIIELDDLKGREMIQPYSNNIVSILNY